MGHSPPVLIRLIIVYDHRVRMNKDSLVGILDRALTLELHCCAILGKPPGNSKYKTTASNSYILH